MTHIVAVLDWEMATIGDPLMDLGTTLAYWTEAADPEPLHHHIVGPTNRARQPDPARDGRALCPPNRP